MKFVKPLFSLRALAAMGVAASALYWGALAEDRYVSEARVSVRSLSNADAPSFMKLVTGLGGASREDELLVRERLRSLDEALEAEAQFNLREHWTRDGYDYFWSLAQQAPREQFLRMWRRMVSVEVEEPSGALVIQAQGFTPEAAQRLATHLVSRSERFANEVFNRLAREQLLFANTEMDKVEARLSAAREALARFQREHAIYDLDAQAREQAALVARLQTALAEAQAELSQLRTTMTEDAAAVVVARGKVRALTAQVGAQQRQLGTGRKSEDAVRWASLRREVEFLEAEWRTTQASVEKTRAESLRKVRSLIVMEPAQPPQEALKPQRWQGFFLWSLLSLMATGCTWLVRGLIKEQSWRY